MAKCVFNYLENISVCRFDLFSREIGTIIYSLGCFPTQADLQDFIAEVRSQCLYFAYILAYIKTVRFERSGLRIPSFILIHSQLEEDQTGFIHLDKFLPAATNVLLEKK